ncbi:MAG: M28 family peptidase [Pseudomonadota bacterium]
MFRIPPFIIPALISMLALAMPHRARGADIAPPVRATAEALIDQALASTLAYELLESLTTEVGPRLAGSANDARAVAWAMANLQNLGFDRVWSEPVAVTAWARGAESAAIIAPFPQALAVTALGGSIATPAAGLEAEVVSFLDVVDLAAADPAEVAGKIVYLGKRMSRAQDGSGYGPTVVNRRDGASLAARLGARALVIRSVGTDGNRLPHTGLLRYDEKRGKIPAAALANPDADLLEAVLARGQPVRLKLTLAPRDLGPATSHNVIAEISGRARPEDIVLIGAHLDSWDLGTGAIDDGAGVAITVAAAKLIADLPASQRPARSLRLVLFAAEETGLFGARAYAEAHHDTLSHHVLAWESDFGAGRVWQIQAGVGSGALDGVKAMARLLIPLGIDYGGEGGHGGPDIGPLRAAGVPTLTLAQDGTDYFDLHHTANDTFDKVDPAVLAQNVAAHAAMAYLATMADTDFRAEAP